MGPDPVGWQGPTDRGRGAEGLVAVQYPLSTLALAAASRAEDLGFVALADVARATADLDDVLVIGGQMITLHAYRWGLGAELFRESKDADIGIRRMVARDQGIVERLEAVGYTQRRGGEFIRALEEEPHAIGPSEAAIDVLIPAGTSRPRESVRVADRLVTTEVAGLATALRRPSVEVQLAMTRLSGERLEARISLPDEVSTLILRAHAWRRRLSDTDAVDIWRSLEIAYAAGVTPSDLARSDEADAIDIVRQALSGGGKVAGALGTRMTRARALAARVLGIEFG